MGLPFNFTNPGIYIPGLLTSQEAQYVTDLVDLTYAEGDILYYDGAAMTNLAAGTDGHVLTLASGVPTWAAGGGGGGYTNLTEFVAQTAWRVFYSNGSGDVTELALGADGTYLKSNGASVAPTFATPAGSGDVSKVGTPVDNQIGVWTGDGTIEGDAALTFNTSTDVLSTGGLNLSGLTASQIAATDGSKNIQSLSTATYPSLTELSYVKGTTSSIQTQITAKPTISSGAGTPGSTPTKVGDIYIDTTNDVSYLATGTASSADWTETGSGGGNNYFNNQFIDQSGGTSDTYGVLAGSVNSSNALFTVSEGIYATGTLKVWLNGQLQTQGTSEDFVETTPASGTFTFAVAPTTGDLITVEYQTEALSSDTVAIKSTAMGVIVHGATAGTARPTGYDVVTWIGSVEPTNATTDDLWVDNS